MEDIFHELTNAKWFTNEEHKTTFFTNEGHFNLLNFGWTHELHTPWQQKHGVIHFREKNFVGNNPAIQPIVEFYNHFLPIHHPYIAISIAQLFMVPETILQEKMSSHGASFMLHQPFTDFVLAILAVIANESYPCFQAKRAKMQGHMTMLDENCLIT
ncbi:hypothetical protein ACJX0J_024865 [Zea mays]